MMSLLVPGAAIADESKDKRHERHAGEHREVVVRQLSKLDSGNVYGNDGKQIGHIKGLAIDPAAHRIAYAVVEFDRLADIGDKHFAVPWMALDKKLDDKDFSKITYAMNADADKLKNAKGMDMDNWPDVAELEGQDVYVLWNVKPYHGAEVHVRAGNTQVDVNAGKEKEETRLEGTPVSAGMIVRATDLEGHRILNESGDDIAKLNSVMADVHSGRLVYGIIQINKSPDLDTDYLNPVPFSLLKVSSTGNEAGRKSEFARSDKDFKVVLTTSLDKVKAGPKFPARVA